MITRDEMIKAGEYIRKHVQADDFTFGIYSSDDHLTRFAQSSITQHIAGENLRVGLETAFGQKRGLASVNQLDEDSLKYLIRTAEAMAKINQPDPEFVPSEGPHELPAVINDAEPTADLTVETMVDNIEKCVRNANARQAKVSGVSEKNLSDSFLITKNGFEGFDRHSNFSHSMTMKKGNVETKVSRSVKDYDRFSMDGEIDQLNSQFDSLQEPMPMETGRIPVILRPAAVLHLLYFLTWTLDMREADEGLTPFTGQLGKKFFGDRLTLSSSISDPDIFAPKFDNSAVPNRDITWINKGVLENMKVSRYYAQQKKIKPAALYNLVVPGENTTEAEMMKMVDRGIIINRLWYIRPVDRKKGEMTGLTRDGVLYFEKGAIKHAVTNFRWNEILHDVTRRILALGESIQQESWAKVPAMLIDDFNFVDVTTF